MEAPKVFISYSWTSPAHRTRVRGWADLLIGDGVNVILDVYDLKEGNDKFAFMEKMVTDQTVTHVLIVSDKKYAKKADSREAGVGTESQIISKEVYEKTDQSKYIPIVTEFDDFGEPYLPIFLKTRIWIDFSTPEKVNENWERFVRLLYNKPAYEKPKIGVAPIYITSEGETPISPAIGKFNALKQAILQEKKGLQIYRNDFFSACIKYADELRTRTRPDIDSLPAKILEDTKKLKLVRNHIIDWVLLESEALPSSDFADAIISFLESLLEIKSRPQELNEWNDAWFDAHSLFVYETFLYIIAGLIKTRDYSSLHEVLISSYFMPNSERNSEKPFERFACFYAHSEILQSVLAPEGRKLYSPAAELIKRNAEREDIPFKSIIEADLLIIMMACITDVRYWFPQTYFYSSYGDTYPLFLKATQHKHFLNLAIVTGVSDASKLRDLVKEGLIRLQVERRFFFNKPITESLNLEKLDSIS